MCKRPGQAETQYGDMRGEACVDFFQGIGANTDLQKLAKELGWKGKGIVVGMELSIPERDYSKTTLHCFLVTLQIAEEYDLEKIKGEIKGSDGTLFLKEFKIRNVDISDIIKHFKRFEIGLFINALKPKCIEVIEDE